MQTLDVFHGTNQNFERFEQNKARIANDFYGGGVGYFTTARDIALTYAKSMARKYGGERYVYKVRLTARSIFDVDAKYGIDTLNKLTLTRGDFDQFLRYANLLKPGADKYQLLTQIESGNIEINGDQLFKGLSQGMTKTTKARDQIKRLGFDTLRYNGGGIVKHSVYIPYDSHNITIEEKFMFDANDKPYKRVD